MSNTEYKDITSHSLELFLADVQDAIFEGWTISPSNPGNMAGYYSSTMTVTLQRSAEDKPKLSRAEILANAREAKKAKTNNVASVAAPSGATLDTDNIVQ